MEASATARTLAASTVGDLKQDQAMLNVLLIGCGRLGSAILAGLISNPATRSTVSSISVAVRSAESRARVEQTVILASKLEESTAADLVIILDSSKTAEAIGVANVAILAFSHNDYRQVLQDHEIQQAFRKKGKDITIVSLLGGVSTLELHRTLYAPDPVARDSDVACKFARAMPNVAARVRQSITALSARPLEESVDRIFRLVGETIWLSEEQINTAGALCAASVAFFATIVEALADGVSNRVDYANALAMAASASQGAAALLAAGQDPEQIRQSVISPGGSTAKGMEMMQKLGAIEALKRTMHETVLATEGLDKR